MKTGIYSVLTVSQAGAPHFLYTDSFHPRRSLWIVLLNIHVQLMKPGLSGSPFPGPPAGGWLSSPLCSAVSSTVPGL